MSKITQEEWEAWVNNPVTQEYHKALQQMLLDHKESWAQGDYTRSTLEETIQVNSEALGSVSILTQLINLGAEDYEDLTSGGKA